MNFNYSSDEIVDWSTYYRDLTSNPANSSLDERFTEFGEWSECKDECGFQNQGRSRFLLPALYKGKFIEDTSGLNKSDIEAAKVETRPCYKFCRSEEDVLRKWKEYTGCSASVLPEITNQKIIKSVDEKGDEIEFESAVYIDNLRYYSEEQLERVFSIWKPVDNPDVSRDCYGNKLNDSTILYIGSKIYSKNGVSYLEYGADGSIYFYSLKINGESVSYERVKELRKAPADLYKIGSYVKIIAGSLTVFSSQNVKLYEVSMIGGQSVDCNIVVGETGLLVVERNNNVLNVVGGVQSEYYVRDTEFVFNSLPAGEYAILSNNLGTSYLSISSSGVKLVNEDKVVWQLGANGCSVILNNKGLKVVDNSGTNLFQLLVSECSTISLYGNNVEFYSTVSSNGSVECLCGYIGNTMSLLTEDYKIKKPQSVEEEASCKFECIVEGIVKSQLVYQSDGDLVFKVADDVVWSTGTKLKPSTHFFVSAGEIFIMNNSSIVFRSNSRVAADHNTSVSFLLVSELFLLLLTQKEEIELVRLYPNNIKYNTKSWNSLKTIGAYHLESNYDKYPAFSVRSKNNINKGVGITSSLVDLSSYINLNTSANCAPLDLFCNNTKIENVNSTTGISSFSVDLDVNETKWTDNVKTVAVTNPSSNLSFDYNSPSAYLYSSKKILGYDLLVEEENLGDYSTPFIYLKTNNGSASVRLLMKKEVDEFVSDIIDSSSAEDFMINLSKDTIFGETISSMFGIKLHSTFRFDSTLSSFSDNNIASEIMETRVDMLETACMNKNMLSDNCQIAFNKIKFYSERAAKYYDLNMELECRKDFTHSNCSGYIQSSTGVLNFINNYCGRVKNAFSSDCTKICTSSINYLFEKCRIRDNIYIFVLIVVLVVILSIKRVTRLLPLNFLKANTITTTETKNSIK